MRKIYLVLISSLILWGCSSTTPSPREEKDKESVGRRDSVALSFLKEDTVSQKKEGKETEIDTASVKAEEISFDTSKVKFIIEPSDSFNLASSKFLKLKVLPPENMQELYYKWEDPAGKQKKYKQVNNIKNMSPLEVKRKIGEGNKKITAIYHFQKNLSPIKREDSIAIYSAQDTLLTGEERGKGPQKEKIETKTKRIKKDKEILLQKDSLSILKKELDLLKQGYFDDIFFDQGEWQLPSNDFNSQYWLTFNKVLKLLKTDPQVKILLQGSVDNVEYQKRGLQLGLKRAATIGELIQKLYKPSLREKIGERIYVDSTRKFEFKSSNQRTKLLNRSVSITFSLDTIQKYSTLYDYHNMEAKTQQVDRKEISDSKKKDKRSIEDKYNKGRELFISNKYEEALQLLRELVDNHPEHSLADNAQWWIGEISYMRENYMEAIPKYKKIFDLGDGNKSAYAQYRIGCCYYKVGEYNRAIAELKKVEEYSDATEVKKKARYTMKRAIEEREKR